MTFTSDFEANTASQNKICLVLLHSLVKPKVQGFHTLIMFAMHYIVSTSKTTDGKTF